MGAMRMWSVRVWDMRCEGVRCEGVTDMPLPPGVEGLESGDVDSGHGPWGIHRVSDRNP